MKHEQKPTSRKTSRKAVVLDEYTPDTNDLSIRRATKYVEVTYTTPSRQRTADSYRMTRRKELASAIKTSPTRKI